VERVAFNAFGMRLCRRTCTHAPSVVLAIGPGKSIQLWIFAMDIVAKVIIRLHSLIREFKIIATRPKYL
jgi:hypothetical protein